MTLFLKVIGVALHSSNHFILGFAWGFIQIQQMNATAASIQNPVERSTMIQPFTVQMKAIANLCLVSHKIHHHSQIPHHNALKQLIPLQAKQDFCGLMTAYTLATNVIKIWPAILRPFNVKFPNLLCNVLTIPTMILSL